MTPDQVLWVVARVAGLSSYAAMAIAMVTGIALRTAVLDWVGSNRALRSLHEYTTVLWIPLAGLHMLSLVLDSTARVGLLDLAMERWHRERQEIDSPLEAEDALRQRVLELRHWVPA